VSVIFSQLTEVRILKLYTLIYVCICTY